MVVPQLAEKYSGKINEVVIGATADEKGTRARRIVGGESTMPFLAFEGNVSHKPVIAMEVIDDVSEDYPKTVRGALEGALQNPASWAKACEERFGADAICLKLRSTNPEGANKSADEAAKTVEAVLRATTLPLLIYGSGNDKKDMEVFQACVDIVKNERVVFGSATQDNYKSLAALAMSANASLVAFSNIDVNLAKQINILLTDFGVKKENIIMDPLMGALGYGLDYSYSVIERIRIGALAGDAMLQMPIICDASIAWNAKEATSDEPLYGGNAEKRGILWEVTTALAALNAGADILIMRHPEAVKGIKKAIDGLTGGLQ